MLASKLLITSAERLKMLASKLLIISAARLKDARVEAADNPRLAAEKP